MKRHSGSRGGCVLDKAILGAACSALERHLLALFSSLTYLAKTENANKFHFFLPSQLAYSKNISSLETLGNYKHFQTSLLPAWDFNGSKLSGRKVKMS